MDQKIQELEQEIKLLKNQIRAVLLDIKENLASHDWQQSGTSPAVDQPHLTGQLPGGSPGGEAGQGSGSLPQIDRNLPGAGAAPGAAWKQPAAPEAPSGTGTPTASRPTHPWGKAASINKATLPVEERETPHTGAENNVNGAGKVDFLRLLLVLQWLERSREALGWVQTQRLVEIYTESANVPPETKQTLKLMLGLTGGDKDSQAVSCALPFLVELDGLFQPKDSSELIQSLAIKLMNGNGNGSKRAACEAHP